MKNTLKIGGNIKRLNEPLIMGILNFTPDSFYKDSRFNCKSEAFLKKAEEMVFEGVDMFDIGGFSTRPGAEILTVNEEINRIIPALIKLKKTFPQIPVSVDTFRSKVAFEALENGADLINDISGGEFDPDMIELISERNCPYIIMHLQGNLDNMHESIIYDDFLENVVGSIFKKANYLKKLGINDVIIDPGFGFSKTIEQNYKLVENLEILNTEDFPILVGMSRKSMVYKLLNINPEESLIFSTYLTGLAMLKGAKIVRVHDISYYKSILKINSILNF